MKTTETLFLIGFFVLASDILFAFLPIPFQTKQLIGQSLALGSECFLIAALLSLALEKDEKDEKL